MRLPRFQVTAAAAIFYPVLYFFDSAGWFSALLPAVLAHETGHILALYTFGSRIDTIRLEITGLCMECASLYRPRQNAVCAAAGPAAGLLWAVTSAQLPGDWAARSAQLSVGLSLFNLLPILPLDGGRILLAVTGRENLTDWCGRITLGLMIAGAMWFRQWHWLFAAGILFLCRIRA